MDEAKYVCEPHYDENGKFDYWNPLFPYKRDTCEGCSHLPQKDNHPFVCDTCCRAWFDHYDKVVE